MTQADMATKGRLLYFLLTDDYGIGESQCKVERLIQCAPIPQHDQRKAKEAIDEMIRSRDVPLYSKGGGARDVVQIVSSDLQQARELANEWHPDRSPGESFDPTDLSEAPVRTTETFSVAYKHKSRVWERLERSKVDFDHRHGAESTTAPADHIEFTVEGVEGEVADLLDDLVDVTNGDLSTCDGETEKPTVTVDASEGDTAL